MKMDNKQQPTTYLFYNTLLDYLITIVSVGQRKNIYVRNKH